MIIIIIKENSKRETIIFLKIHLSKCFENITIFLHHVVYTLFYVKITVLLSFNCQIVCRALLLFKMIPRGPGLIPHSPRQ